MQAKTWSDGLRDKSAVIWRFSICVIVTLFILIPILTAVVNGFKTNGQMMSAPFSLPSPWHWDNYAQILASNTFWRQVANSVVVLAGTVVLTVTISSMVAFVFARFAFLGRDVIVNFFTLGMLFPLAVAILPLYVLIRQMDLIDNLWGVILPQVAFGLPANVLILRDFFRSIPGELEEAASIDGCSPTRFYWKVLLPLGRPALASVAMLTMVSSWNNFLWPLLILNKNTLWTLPLGVMQFRGQYGTDWALVMAYVSLAMAPAIIFYMVAERHLVAGLTQGAVKG